MKTKFNFALFSILLILSLSGCNSKFNEEIMYGTVGSKLEKVAPGEVKISGIESKSNTVSLLWENPTDKDLYGIKISVSVADKSGNPKIPKPITLTADKIEDIPNIYTFYDLTEKTQYTFTIQTFDKNLNFSSGTTTTETPTDKNNNVPKIDDKTITFSPGYNYITIYWKNNDPTNTLLGVTISCKNARTNEVSTVSLPRDNSTNTIPTSYTFNKLINGDQYIFTLYQYDKEYRSEGTPSSCYADKKNKMIVNELDTNNIDSSVILSWTNPSDDNFYGIQLKCEPAEGNLSSPVYFMKKEYPIIPSSFTAIGLTNNKPYKFSISTLDSEMILGNENSITGKPNPTSNKNEIQNFKSVPGNGYVDLFWKLPENTSLLEKYELYISPSLQTIQLSDISTTSYRATGLTNGTAYTFTLRTVDISGNYSKGSATEARPDTGSSGIFDNEDLFRYKNTCYAYDFGYCDDATEKTFTFTSVTQMNLSNNPVSSVMGKSGVYSIVSAQNITGDSYGLKQVNPGDEFEIKIRYTPSKYDGTETTASWDEAEVKIGNVSENTIRLIGSNYPQPKSISTKKNQLRIWLRADLIQDSNLTDSKKVKSLPDYSGNNFNAVCTDNTYDKAPSYKKNDSDFNSLPSIDFSNGNTSTNLPQQQTQLIASGSSGNPIISGEEGSTTFIVYNLGIANTHRYSEQTIISANYGTGWPVLKNLHRYYNAKNGWFVTNDYKYGLAVRGSGMAGTWRWACISNETENNPYNRMLVTGAHPDATNLIGEKMSDNDKIGSKTLSSCLIYDRTISPTSQTEDLPSNTRMFVNGDERLLGYIESQSSTYTEQYLKTNFGTEEEPLLSKSNKYTTVGCYGYPFGNGKGGRSGTLTDTLYPRSTTSSSYSTWYNTTKSNTIRPYDKAMSFNSAKSINGNISGTSTEASATKQADYFENWLPQDIWRNGTINTLTLGADFNNASYSYCRIAEVFIFEGALSDEDIEAMNNYIKYRYKTTVISTNVSDYN